MSRSLSIMLLVFVLALCGVLLGVQAWTGSQVRRGLAEVMTNNDAEYERGRLRLIKMGPRAVATVCEAAESVNPHTHGRSIENDQIFWRLVTLVGDLNDTTTLPHLLRWLREDELDGFQASADSISYIAIQHPDDADAIAAFDAIADAMLQTKRSENVEFAMSLLSDEGKGRHAEVILKLWKKHGFGKLSMDAYMIPVEKIASHGETFDVSLLRDTEGWPAKVWLGRILCYQGKAEGLDFLAEALRHREELSNPMDVLLACIGFDLFTDRNLQSSMKDTQLDLDEKIVKYLSLYQDHLDNGKEIYRKFKP